MAFKGRQGGGAGEVSGLPPLDTTPISDVFLPESVEQARDRWRAGEISFPEVALTAAGSVGRGVENINVIGHAQDAAISGYLNYTVPGMLLRTAGGAVWDAVKDTAPVQAAQEFIEENPRTVENLSQAADAAEIIPAVAAVRAIPNSIFSEVKTKLPGFYDGRQVGAMWDAIVEGGDETLRNLFTGQSIANLREKGGGAGVQRNKELLTGVQNDVVGNKLATHYQSSQRLGQWDTESISGQLPTVNAQIRGRFTEGDTGIVPSLMGDSNASEYIANDLYQRALRNQRQEGGKERWLRRFFDVGRLGERGALIGVRNTRSGHSSLGAEVLGHQRAGSPTIRGLRGEPLAIFASGKTKTLPDGTKVPKTPDDLDAHEIAEFIKHSHAFERGNFYGLQKELGETSGHTELMKAYHTARNKPADARTDKQQALVDAVTARNRGRPNTFGRFDQLKYYAMKQKKNPSDDDRAFMDYYEANQGGGGTANVHVGEDGLVRFRTSFTSGDTDLGGVGAGYTIDANNQQLYGMIDDGHDMYGVNPVGGKALYNFTPVQQTGYGSRREDLTGRFSRDAETQAQIDRDAEALKERTGFQPKAAEPAEPTAEYYERAGATRRPKETFTELQERTGEPALKGETMKKYTERTGHAPTPAESMKEFEARTGVKKRAAKPEESVPALENRIMNEYMAPVRLTDRLKAGRNAAVTGVGLTTAGDLPAYLLNDDAKQGMMELLKQVGDVTGQSARKLMGG